MTKRTFSKYGQIILFKNRNNEFMHKWIRFFTRSPYTHVAIMFPDVLGERSYFGAEAATDIRPFSDTINDPDCAYEVWQVIGFSQQEIDEVLHKLYMTYAGVTYGFPKLFWFCYRWLMEAWPFYKDVRREHNWFPYHQICSEIGWWWFEYLCLLQPERMSKVREVLHQWNSNTFDTHDPLDLMKQFPEYFVLVESKGYGS